MALVLKDRVKETTTTSGTGTYTLGGAETGFEAFSSIGNGNTTYYCCTDGSDFEIGIGTYTLSGTTLVRTTILQSSNSDAAVSWNAGSTRIIFCTQPGEKAVYLDGSDQLVINGTSVTSTAAELNILDGVTASATDINLIDGITNGTVIASKALIADANIDITGGRNITITGEIDAATGDFSGAVDVAGATTVAAITASGLVTANAKIDLNGTELILDADADTSITADTDDQIDIRVAGTDQVTIKDGAISPVTDSDVDLGTTSLRYKDAFIDTITTTGNVTVGGDLTISGDDLVMATNTAGALLIADGTNFNPTAVGDLSEISTVANDDVFLAVDTSGGGLKKITRSAVIAGLATSGAISNVSEDSTPQLGGNLDMNGNDIVTTSNATIDLAPNGTGTVVVRGNTNSGAIVFNCESNSHGQTVIAQPHSASVTNTMLLPAGASSTLVSLVSADTLTNKTLTAPTMTGTSTMADLDISGDVDVDGTLEADAITVNGTALATVIAGTTVTNATNSAHVLVTDNESTNEENLIAFVEGATSSTGNVGLEMDGNFAYNPSTGTVSATVFKGNIDAVDGDFDGTLEADAITIGGTAVGSIFSPIAGGTGILTTGALDAGSITSGFGTINNGASAITTTGAVGTGALTAGGLVTANANVLLAGTTPTLTIGDAGAEDAKIVFDGSAQDFHIGLDDTADDLVIGLGSALGTTPAISIDENLLVTIEDDVTVDGRARSSTYTALNMLLQNGSNDEVNLALGNNFIATTTAGSTVFTFENPIIGQSGTIMFVNAGNHSVSMHASVNISAASLAVLQVTGTYMVSYFCSAASGDDTIFLSVSQALV